MLQSYMKQINDMPSEKKKPSQDVHSKIVHTKNQVIKNSPGYKNTRIYFSLSYVQITANTTVALVIK